MADRHKNTGLSWHPPGELSAWARAEAERRAVPLAAILTEALTAYRDAQTGQDSDMPPATNGNGAHHD